MNHVALDPAGRMVAVGGDEGAGIWDLRSGERIVGLAGHSAPVWATAFSPDGECVASGGEDGRIRLWDPRSGVNLVVLRGHAAPVWDLAFSPDGSRLASISHDGVIRIWALDVDDLIELAERELTRSFTDEECRQYLACRAVSVASPRVTRCVTQDEPVDDGGDGNTSPDALLGPAADQVQVKAERAGGGDGRVYRVSFTVSDELGATCSGVVTVAVPHDRSTDAAVDSGEVHDSTQP